MMKKITLIITLSLFVLGAALCVYWGIRIASDVQVFVQSAEKVTGVFVSYDTSSVPGRVGGVKLRHLPIIEFKTKTGETIRFRSETATMLHAYAPGERVEVLYSVVDPQAARINTFFHLYASVTAFMFVGLILLAVALKMGYDLFVRKV